MQVKVEDPASSRRGASATSPSVSAPVPEPVSPLTSIRAIRSEFSWLESAFKFPPILDIDHSEVAVTSNNAPVRAYEHALNGLLERLDAIESDGNEEVRDVRREVVREVERALGEVERKDKEQAPQAPVPEVTEQQASDVEGEDPSASATQVAPPAVVHVTEAAKPTLRNLAPFAPVAFQTDADIDVAISAEYRSASPVATPPGVVVVERDTVDAARANGEGSTVSGADAEAVPASEDASDSIANDQFTFRPRPAFSESSTNSGETVQAPARTNSANHWCACGRGCAWKEDCDLLRLNLITASN